MMKQVAIALLTGALALPFGHSAWAQGNAPASSPASTEHPDPLVRMHQQVAAANHLYDKKVAAAKRVYDHKKAEAKKERDAAIKAAHASAG
jgi:hypothetical protein